MVNGCGGWLARWSPLLVAGGIRPSELQVVTYRHNGCQDSFLFTLLYWV